jgi:hypothetical protein
VRAYEIRWTMGPREGRLTVDAKNGNDARLLASNMMRIMGCRDFALRVLSDRGWQRHVPFKEGGVARERRWARRLKEQSHKMSLDGFSLG